MWAWQVGVGASHHCAPSQQGKASCPCVIMASPPVLCERAMPGCTAGCMTTLQHTTFLPHRHPALSAVSPARPAYIRAGRCSSAWSRKPCCSDPGPPHQAVLSPRPAPPGCALTQARPTRLCSHPGPPHQAVLSPRPTTPGCALTQARPTKLCPSAWVRRLIYTRFAACSFTRPWRLRHTRPLGARAQHRAGAQDRGGGGPDGIEEKNAAAATFHLRGAYPPVAAPHAHPGSRRLGGTHNSCGSAHSDISSTQN